MQAILAKGSFEMKKKWRKTLASAIVIAMALGLMYVMPPQAHATGSVYYVATTGNDATGTGTLGNPWKTIQKAASVMMAGDTCYIRGGTYRETVTPANSGTSGNPVTFMNYNNEVVTVSGTDELTGGWTLDAGQIYYTPMNWDLADSNQIFINGVMIEEARWPNNVGTLVNPTISYADSGTDATHIVDADLPGGNGYWNGATVWIVGGWAQTIGLTTTVTAYNAATGTLTTDPLTKASGDAYDPAPGNRYYLSGVKNALDTAGEWWYDSANSRLYLWAPGGGVPSNVEAKKRFVSFDVSDRSYIEVQGIRTLASRIVTDSDSAHIKFKNMTIEYVGHSDQSTMLGEQAQIGIALLGTDIEISDSELAYSSGPILYDQGINNKIVNNYIHDGAYMVDWEGAVSIGFFGGLRSYGLLLSHNTIAESGHAGISMLGVEGAVIEYNDIYNVNYNVQDYGIIYSMSTDAQNTEIHHNLIHGNRAHDKAPGIYLDSMVNNVLIYNNVIYEVTDSIWLSKPDNYVLVYNNTFDLSAESLRAWFTAFDNDMYGDKVYNNIIKGIHTIDSPYLEHGNNVTASPDFVDSAHGNYRLLGTSSAIDAGRVVPGITDGYAGAAPDAGAYEYNGTDWSAGHNFASSPNPTYAQIDTTYRNRVKNGGFETGDLTSWTKTDQATASANYAQAWFTETADARTGWYALRMGGGVDGVEQAITGLAPNTRYELSAYMKVTAGAESVSLGVKNFGGTEQLRSTNETGWVRKTLEFTTGSTDTSATIYCRKTSAGAGYAFCDDIGLQFKSGIAFEDGFESGFGNWAALYGTPTRTTAQAREGAYSYLPDETQDWIAHYMVARQNKIAEMWFYDDAADTSLMYAGRVYDGTTIVELGVDTSTSVTHYVYRVGGTSTASHIARTTGWHKLTWDYTSGEDVKLYIDGSRVGVSASVKWFDRIELGGAWGYTGDVYFDHIVVMDAPVFSDSFEGGFGHWDSLYGTATRTTDQAVEGVYSYAPDEDQDWIRHNLSSSQNRIAVMRYYDDAADTSLMYAGRVYDGTTIVELGTDTSTSTTHYVYRVGNTSTASSIPRSTGWHELKWDYTSGTNVRLYIDGVWVATSSAVTSFNTIQMGDAWNGYNGTAYLDDVTVW